MSSREASPASLFPMLEKEAGERTSVISGRKCSVLLTKSGPLGSLVRTLLASPLWSKAGYSLNWDAAPLYSKRVSLFTTTSSNKPTPSKKLPKDSKVSDIPSSRCLFRLRLSEHPTVETEFSSSPIMMLKTPSAFDAASERMKSKGISGTPGTLAQEIANGRAQKRGLILPTPTAGEAEKYRLQYTPGSQMGMSLSAMGASGMLPTPTARDFKNPSSPDGERIARKKEQGWTIELSDLAAMKMLPTPSARDYQPPYNPDFMVRKNGMVRDDQLSSLPTMLGLKERGGITFRLSPLFTQEMMGFPLGWTEFPFLPQCNPGITVTPTASDSTSDDGARNPSKPTETR